MITGFIIFLAFVISIGTIFTLIVVYDRKPLPCYCFGLLSFLSISVISTTIFIWVS